MANGRRPSDNGRASSDSLKGWVALVSGVAVIFTATAAWIVTGRETSILVGAGVSLVALGLHLEVGKRDS